ncbi:hypothetical protein SSX86_024647 [Deinandra increscens subsp. villosa]|uniref:AB hydrolase-1 domain-containing protein n=1 Tax=Deinandra increscens subsp. villosa TaxID=3103831 RepID=A0AAP0CHR7_9ASTR
MPIFFPRSNKFTQLLLAFPNRHRLVATVVWPSSPMEAPPNGYRRNVNIYLINSSKKIFSASRLDIPEAWQMPQGAEYISIATGMVLKNTTVEERLLALKYKNLDFVQADALLLQLRLLMKNVVGSDAMTLVTCIDLKGAGIDPSDPNTILSFDEYNKPLLDFLSSLPHNQKVILVGHSAGGLSVTQATHKFPNKISLVIYIAATMLKNGFLTEQDTKDMDEAVISISTVKTDDEITGKCIQKPKLEVLMTLNEQYDKPKADVIILKSKRGRGQPKDTIVDGKTDVKNAADFVEAQEFTCVAAADPTCDDSELPPSAAAAADPTCVLFSAYQSHPKVQMNIP